MNSPRIQCLSVKSVNLPLRMSKAIDEAKEDFRQGRFYTTEEFEAEMEKTMAAKTYDVALRNALLFDLTKLSLAKANKAIGPSGMSPSEARHADVSQSSRLFKRSYRILYRINDDSKLTVEVRIMRFWHSHRDEPRFRSSTHSPLQPRQIPLRIQRCGASLSRGRDRLQKR